MKLVLTKLLEECENLQLAFKFASSFQGIGQLGILEHLYRLQIWAGSFPGECPKALQNLMSARVCIA